jgi:AcrR family transcriptional regulator
LTAILSIVTVGDVARAQEVDGRRRRREQNREAVLDALVALFGEGTYQPTADEVAERAGISARSLFRYFDDADDLSRAAIERELGTAAPLLALDVDPTLPTGDKVIAVVEARGRLYDAVAATARVARLSAHRNPVVADQLARRRSLFRSQVAAAFAPELDALAPTRPHTLATVDVLCSFETFELLRQAQGLSRRATRAALVDSLLALLAPPGGHR